MDKQGEHPAPVRGSRRENLAAPMTRSRGTTAQMLWSKWIVLLRCAAKLPDENFGQVFCLMAIWKVAGMLKTKALGWMGDADWLDLVERAYFCLPPTVTSERVWVNAENWANVQTGSQEIREMHQQESKAAAGLRFCATANCVSNNGDINSHTAQKQSPKRFWFCIQELLPE